MITRNRILFILGLWIVLMPFLGFPSSYETVFIIVSGLVVVLFAFLYARDKRLGHVYEENSRGDVENNVYEESRPVEKRFGYATNLNSNSNSKSTPVTASAPVSAPISAPVAPAAASSFSSNIPSSSANTVSSNSSNSSVSAAPVSISMPSRMPSRIRVSRMSEKTRLQTQRIASHPQNF